MPVLSGSSPQHGITNPPSSITLYLLLSAILLIFILIFITRRKSAPSTGTDMSSPLLNEKDKTPSSSSPLDQISEPQSASLPEASKPRIQRPPQPPPFTPPTLVQSSFETKLDTEMPRRRSYTKTISSPTITTSEGNVIDGRDIEVSGEIIVAEGWRRHTRVFGGGVCKACEESERRMSA